MNSIVRPDEPMTIHLTREEFLAKIDYVPSIIHDWADAIGGLAGKRILDFGCGEGLQAAGIASRYQPGAVFGVDINDEHQSLQAILGGNGRTIDGAVPQFHRIAPGQRLPFKDIDLIYSWSVFEHIDNRIFDDVVSDIRSTLSPDGHLFIQIAPLYFSPEGSHLWAFGYRNWEHLTKQIDHIRAETEQLDGQWSLFSTLNRITANDLVRRIEAGGFRLLRRYETKTEKMPPDALLDVYHEDVLRTDQVVVMFQRV